MNDSRTRWLRAKVPPYVKHGAGATVAPDPVPATPVPEWVPIPLFYGPAENWARIAFGWLELANITHGSQRDDYRARVRANLGEALMLASLSAPIDPATFASRPLSDRSPFDLDDVPRNTPTPRTPWESDRERLEKAEAKRARKAARRKSQP